MGIGLNARRLRENFLKKFVVTYSLRPIGELGTVFRKYPELWKVFVEEPDLPGRYRLVEERPSRPAGEALDLILQRALNPDGVDENGAPQSGQGLADTLKTTFTSMQRFMRSLSQ